MKGGNAEIHSGRKKELSYTKTKEFPITNHGKPEVPINEYFTKDREMEKALNDLYCKWKETKTYRKSEDAGFSIRNKKISEGNINNSEWNRNAIKKHDG